MSGHAKLSPSSAARWLRCLGSVLGPQSDESSEFADEGTAAHQVGSLALANGIPCATMIGARAAVFRHGCTLFPSSEPSPVVCNGEVARYEKIVDEEMASYVQVYVDTVRDRLHDGAQLLVEQRVDTGIRDDEGNPVDGTGDAIILDPAFGLIDVHDLKYGKGHKVWGVRRVSEIPDGLCMGPLLLLEGERYEMNPQLATYGLGALNQFGLLGDFKKVRVTIHQPRLDHMSEATIDVEDLLAWGEGVKQFILAWDTSLHPGDEQCQWCPRKATCSALLQRVTDTVLSDFANVADLTEFGVAKAYENVELVKSWLAAIEDAARNLADKGQLPGWKLVEGRQGNRAWKDEKTVATLFKDTYRMKDEEMYSKKLISPTDAEKKLAKTNPTRWERLQEFIKRGAPSKALVRESDPRPAADSTRVLDDFRPVSPLNPPEFSAPYGQEFNDLIGTAG